MPSNRRSNAAGKAAKKGSNSRGAGSRQAARGRGSAEKASQGLSSTQNDIFGVILAVVAVAMFSWTPAHAGLWRWRDPRAHSALHLCVHILHG
jgi:hypothetical protein